MNQLTNFWQSVKTEETAILATSAGSSVTMRIVSPVYYEDAILIFTSADSLKYRQLKDNPLCCVDVGACFMEAKAQFLGSTMLDENKIYRNVYSVKFKDAFDDAVDFGGKDAEFILLKPIKLMGWDFEKGVPTGPFEYLF